MILVVTEGSPPDLESGRERELDYYRGVYRLLDVVLRERGTVSPKLTGGA